MHAAIDQLETAYEEALCSFLEAEGSEKEARAYRDFLEAFEALKAFETQSETGAAAA